MLQEVKEQLKSTGIVEDKEFILALINGNIEKEEHKQKQGRMLELMKKIEKLETLSNQSLILISLLLK